MQRTQRPHTQTSTHSCPPLACSPRLSPFASPPVASVVRACAHQDSGCLDSRCEASTSQLSARLGRRSLLSGVTLVLGLASQAQPSSAAVITAEEIQQELQGNSSVLPALTVREYTARIIKTRQKAFDEMRQLIDDGKYLAVSLNLSIDPFDTIYQSCFFLPWALLKEGELDSAAKCYDAYINMQTGLKEFDRLCVAASRNQVEDEEVLAGLDKLERTLDEVLAVAAFA